MPIRFLRKVNIAVILLLMSVGLILFSQSFSSQLNSSSGYIGEVDLFESVQVDTDTDTQPDTLPLYFDLTGVYSNSLIILVFGIFLTEKRANRNNQVSIHSSYPRAPPYITL